MSGVFSFDPKETEIIARMYKERLPTRQIAKILGKPPIEVSDYIKAVLVKKPKPATIIGAAKPEVITEEVQRIRHARTHGGLRHYTDPLAARDGSRKLLEAVHAYFAKREGKPA